MISVPKKTTEPTDLPVGLPSPFPDWGKAGMGADAPTTKAVGSNDKE
jgi:hypothetical protein